MVVSRWSAFISVAIAALVGGCRGELSPLETDPEIVAAQAKVKPGSERARLAMSQVETPYKPAYDLDKDSSRYPATVDRAATRASLRDAIGGFSGFHAPHEVGGDTFASALLDAHASRDEVLVRPVLTKLDCVWDGRNGLYVPNLFLCFYLWVPSWWVADEDFKLEGEFSLEYWSVASERLLYHVTTPIDVTWPLDDFERGWSWTGIVTAPNTIDPDDWAKVSESMAPLLRRDTAKAAALDAAGRLPGYLQSDDFRAKDATVFALVCGVSRHERGITGPAGAAADAAKATTFLHQRARIPGKNIRTLVDNAATRAGVEKAIAEHLARSRPGDTVLIYWSGLGAAGASAPDASALTSNGGGTAADEPDRFLLPYDADRAHLGKTALSLAQLREMLEKVPAKRIVVILDSSFGPGREASRSLALAAGARPPSTDKALERWTERRGGKEITLLVGASPGEDAIDLAGAGRGLLSYLFEEGAGGTADIDHDGAVTASELEAFLEREVPAQSGLEGAPQTPRVYRQGRRAAAADPAGKTPWLPNAGAR